MKSEEQNLDKAQKLMLLQGISLIQDGFQFIEWSDEMPNEKSYDLLMILRDRFQLFQEFVLDGSADHLIIDKIKNRAENVKHGYELNQEIQKQLKELRELVRNKQRPKKEDQQ